MRDDAEETAPGFAHHEGDDLPVHEDGGLWQRLLAGEAFGLCSAAMTHSPLFYVHAALQRGARVELPRQYAERAVYLVSGAVEVYGRVIDRLRMAVLTEGAETVIEALVPSVLMLLGGDPVYAASYGGWTFAYGLRASASSSGISCHRRASGSSKRKRPDEIAGPGQ